MLSEVYNSIQGEGPNVGQPTTFVRFAGCNMRCPGWPCDTPYAIDPAIWRYESMKASTMWVAEQILDLKPRHVCFTGGEPFMQPWEELQELWAKLHTRDQFS